jgi:hypothetical protein
MMKAKIAVCLMICCNLLLEIGFITNCNGGGKMVVGTWWGLRKWWNGCWNVVGTCEMMKGLMVGSGHWGRCRFRLCVEHQNLKLHYHMKLWVPTTKV